MQPALTDWGRCLHVYAVSLRSSASPQHWTRLVMFELTRPLSQMTAPAVATVSWYLLCATPRWSGSRGLSTQLSLGRGTSMPRSVTPSDGSSRCSTARCCSV
jgi:hypothetical protein